MDYVERALTFDCCGESLVGVLAQPAHAHELGFVIVVGGPQYRAGSHRQFVMLGRRLAAAGFAVLRFDHRGMGDSTGPSRSFDDIDRDIAAAIDALQSACPTTARVVLWGLCDAASAALMYWQATRDARVAGLALVNPWARSDATIAKAHLRHYYGRRLLQREFWMKVLRGRFAVGKAAGSLARNVAAANTAPRKAEAARGTAFQDRMADGLRGFPGPVLILLSERDLTAQEFVEYARSDPHWKGLLTRGNIARQQVANADHTFSTEQWRTDVEDRTLAWTRRTLCAERR